MEGKAIASHAGSNPKGSADLQLTMGGGTPPIFQAYVWGGGDVVMHPESKIFPAQKPTISQDPWGG